VQARIKSGLYVQLIVKPAQRQPLCGSVRLENLKQKAATPKGFSKAKSWHLKITDFRKCLLSFEMRGRRPFQAPDLG